MDAVACPCLEELTSYLSGSLAHARHETLTAHIDGCTACQQRLEEIAVTSLHADLRREAPSSPFAQEPERARAVAGGQAAGRNTTRYRRERSAADRGLPHRDRDDELRAALAHAGIGLPQPGEQDAALGRLAHFKLLEILGQGGFGIVFRAFDEVLQRVVALKILSPKLAATDPDRKRFLREARAAAQVRHEHVVQIYTVQEQPLPYLVMEFVPGENLQRRLDRTGRLEMAAVVTIGRQLAEGLAAAHAVGLIHRDIKPANILLEAGPRWWVKLTDFGLARATDNARLTESGMVAGTPSYMSPEQARGDPLDHRSDLFSLGSVLYALTTGRAPFQAEHPLVALRRVTDEPPRPITALLPETPVWLCRLIDSLLAKSACERPQTAAEVAAALSGASAPDVKPTTAVQAREPPAAQEPDTRLVPVTPAQAYGAARRRWPARIKRSAASAALVAMLAVAAYLLPRAADDPTADRRPEATSPRQEHTSPTRVKPSPIPAAVGSAIPLLPLIDVTRDSVDAEWQLADGILTCPTKPGTHRLQLPYCPPAEYDLSLCAERKRDTNGLLIGLVVGGRQVVVVLNGWTGQISGLNMINGQRACDNATRVNGDLLPIGIPCRIDCSVRANRLTVAVQGSKRIEWYGDPAVLSVTPEEAVPNPHCLFLHNNSCDLTELSVRPLSRPGWQFSAPVNTPVARVAAERLLWQRSCQLVIVPTGGQPMALASLANLPRGTFQISTLSAPPDAMADRIVALLPQRLELHRLELDHTGLTDAGSGPLTRLARLEELSVVNTLLSDAVLENLAGIPGLKRLRVGWAQCSAPALAQFAKRVPGCQVQQLSAEQTTARTFLALGGGIRILNKDGTNRRIERLADLPAGAEIRLHAVALPQGRATAHRHLHCLRNLADLRSFGSWYNGINDDGVLPWRDLPRLEEVELGTNRLTARGLAHLSGFTTIRTLNLNLSTCDDAGLVHVAKLGRLESLSLRQTAVTDVSVEPLSKLSQLKDLDLRGTKITPEGAKRLRQALPGCQLRHP